MRVDGKFILKFKEYFASNRQKIMDVYTSNFTVYKSDYSDNYHLFFERNTAIYYMMFQYS